MRAQSAPKAILLLVIEVKTHLWETLTLRLSKLGAELSERNGSFPRQMQTFGATLVPPEGRMSAFGMGSTRVADNEPPRRA